MRFKKPNEVILKDLESFLYVVENHRALLNCTIKDVDFSDNNIDWDALLIKGTSFLGCRMSDEVESTLRKKGAVIFSKPDNLPYNPYRNELYSWQELKHGYSEAEDESTDLKIYRHFSESRFNPPVLEALYQRIHDHSIDDALRILLKFDEEGMTTKKCVGMMGGHGTSRLDPFYRKTAQTAKLLAEAGYYIVTGGGPGIMEAANLGAYMADRSFEDLNEALSILSSAPTYTDKGHHETAERVVQEFPKGALSLAIPTWFYGHEPSNLFASGIAKYFSNSIREDTLLAISLYGIVFAPGSAGTTQEIFMDAAQNHYGTYNYFSPMIFLGKQRYAEETSIYKLVRELSEGTEYASLTHLTDEPEDVLRFLEENPPENKNGI